MTYQWLRYLHVAAALAFLAVHGASIAVLYVARRERDRRRLLAVLDFSGRTASAMYVSLVAIVVTGLAMGALRTSLFGERWYWAALVLLATITGLMLAVAKPFTTRLRTACEIRPTGIPRISDEELAEILRSGRPHLITVIGVAGLAAMLYLMIFQPGLGAGPDRPPPTTTTLAGDAELLARGREIYEVTVGCINCHGVDGEGSGFAPRIAGRTAEDIATALQTVAAMSDIELSPEELAAVARYVGQLPG